MVGAEAAIVGVRTDDARRVRSNSGMLATAALSVIAYVLITAALLAYDVSHRDVIVPSATVLFLLVIGSSLASVFRLDRTDTLDAGAGSELIKYNRYLVFLGILMLVTGLANAYTFIATASVSTSDSIAQSAADDARRLIIAVLMGILGSLFFTANSLIRKRSELFEPFDEHHFWAGFAFRLGETIVFVLVFFLFFGYSKGLGLGPDATELTSAIPLLALLLGMFVKSGERLVFGLAERIFAMIDALLPGPSGARVAFGEPRNFTAIKEADGKRYKLTWEAPGIGPRPESYLLFKTPNVQQPGTLEATFSAEKTTVSDDFFTVFLEGSQIDVTASYYLVARSYAGEDSKRSNVIQLPK